VLRRRAGERPKRAPETARRYEEKEAEDLELLQRGGPEWFATVRGDQPQEREEEREGIGSLSEQADEQLYGGTDGGEQSDEQFAEGLEFNPRRKPAGVRYMTLGAYMAGAQYVANAESVLPSAIRMMSAMSLPF
jgi:hypothetical protein